MAILAGLGASALVATGLVACGSDDGSGGQGAQGGTLEVSFAAFPELDPQLSYTAEGWTSIYNTYIPLLTYAHAEGTAGSEVIPGLAEDLPKQSNGGKTYELTLRDGLQYSDGRPVRASDFKASVERLFEIESGASPFFADIVGAEDFMEGKADGIAGIEVDDASGEISIDLRSPSGTFVNELAMPFTAPVPPDTPAKDQTPNPPPATGPYEIVESNPGRNIVFERNPRWDRNNADILSDLPGGHVDRIEVDIVRNQSSQVNEVERGEKDWMFDPLPPDRVAQVEAKYEGSQYREVPAINTYFFWMNTTRPPFDDIKVRQAVNYAIDPAALERIYAGQLEGSQQVLPPGMPGYEKYELYPHDMAKAEAMIREAKPSDTQITVWTDSLSPNDDAGAYYQDVLEQLGFDAELKALGDNFFSVVGNTSTPDLDTGWLNWFEDYPHPNDFFEPLLSGESIAATNNGNPAQIDVPDLNRKIEELGAAQLDSGVEAEYAKLDREFMELAPWAPFGNRTLSLFVSDDVEFDEVIWNPTFSGDLTSFQLR
jgi:peptide/nickel transport system substrate-binding protein